MKARAFGHTTAVTAGIALVLLSGLAKAGRSAGPSAVSGKDGAVDLTGYWVSVITQNWRLRMVVPPRGDYMGIPMTLEAKKVADAWDPARDEATGNQCRGYGAAAIMTLPERLHITWQDDNTLKMEIDAGLQTRLLHFGGSTPDSGRPSWQGRSVAAWVPRRSAGIAPSTPAAKYLQVTTTHLRPGHLRKNGVPYGEKATLTEYYDLFSEPTGETWVIVTTVVTDPVYLENPLILTAQFMKETDGSRWDPTPCSARW
jgi:hypothetical protein